jgi:hypothetical protein
VPFCHWLLRHFVAREGYEYKPERDPISWRGRLLYQRPETVTH